MTRTLLGWMALAMLATSAFAGPKVDPKAEGKAKEKIAETAFAAADELLAMGAHLEAAKALAEAEAVGGDKARLDAAKAKVDPKAAASEAGAARFEKLASELAKAYDKLGAQTHETFDAPRFEGYLFRAATLEPTKARFAKLFTVVKQASGNKGQAEATGRMLVRLRDLDSAGAAEGKYDALEQGLAADDVALIKSPTHPMVGWVALPSGWTKKGPWQVLVAVEGAGSAFVGAARGFRGSRGSRKALVLTPCTLSNTNALDASKYSVYDPALLKAWDSRRVEFDVAGLEALHAVLRERYGAEDKLAMTGFSGGGNLCYSYTLRHPERVWCAAPACANFQPGLVGDAKPVEDGGPPVHILTGEKDEHREHVFGNKPGIEGQSDWAQEAFTKLKFTRVKRTMLPGVGHSSCAKEVWEFFDEVLATR